MRSNKGDLDGLLESPYTTIGTNSSRKGLADVSEKLDRRDALKKIGQAGIGLAGGALLAEEAAAGSKPSSQKAREKELERRRRRVEKLRKAGLPVYVPI